MNGIFLLDQGLGETASPARPQDSPRFANTGWDEDLRTFGPWEAVKNDIPGLLRSFEPCDVPAFVCDEATSAFDVAWTLEKQGTFPDFASVLAISQTRGRGQLRRPWASPPGNLHAVLRWPEPVDHGPLVTLMAGLALLRALAVVLPDDVHRSLSLKWPNDVLFNGCKTAGVLAEERGGVLCVGMGLNLRHAPDRAELRQGWAVEATTLPHTGLGGPLSTWLALLPALRAEHGRIYELDANTIIARVSDHLAGVGMQVSLHDGHASNVSGTLLGLAPDGGLKLATDQGVRIIHSGSMTFISA